jgi:UDP-N-acetylmuramoyl-tripeptide--D-alanyl-D-alanine ligase
MWLLEEILSAVRGTPLHIERQAFTGISTDSRNIGEGQLFIPLVGPNFDGHTFVEQAYLKSGGGSLCQKDKAGSCGKTGGTIILVEDTTQALLDLARFRRVRLSATFIGITGSNGKTTTKELLVHIMAGSAQTAYNEKNYNNNIGVSQTLLSIENQPQYCVLELGTNHPGEIPQLARLVEPDLSVITNVNASHLEGLGDLAGVLREKASLFEGTKPEGAIFINLDDPALRPIAGSPPRRVLTFGIAKNADYMLSVDKEHGLSGFDIRLSLRGESVTTTTRLLGMHNLYNILTAAAIASYIKVPPQDIADRIASFEPYPGRFRAVTSKKGYTVIDDAYNANPASMEWAITTLDTMPCAGKRIAILGDMKELGEKQQEYHRELGRLLKKSKLSAIMFLGEEIRAAFETINNGRARIFPDIGSLIEHVSGIAGKDDIILVKGSRAMNMDKIVEGLI